MKALVTGGAGFIGSALVRALLARGDEVRILDSFVTGCEEAIEQEAEVVVGDIRDLEIVQHACSGVEVIFHEAAIRSVPKSVDDPSFSTEVNVMGTLNVLMGAHEAGVRRVVYASSSSVYGETPKTVNREDMPPNPLSPYAASKLTGEYYCRVWTHLKGLSTVSLRYFNVFGPGQNPDSKYAAVFPGFMSALIAGRAPELHWDGEQARDFTYVEDVAQANLLAADSASNVDGQVVNIGGGRPKTINEVLRSVSETMGCWIDPVHQPKRSGDVRRTHADIERARRLLGWEPLVHWTDAVIATVEWFLERREPQLLLANPKSSSRVAREP